MRVRPRSSLLAVPILAAAGLLLAPLAALAQSGLPATVTLHPETAGPGSVVEVTGIDFPAGEPVILELVNESAATDLAVVVTTESGYFNELVTMPADVAAGTWQLRASALDGSGAARAVDIGADPATGPTEAGLSSGRGNSGTDVMVMIILAIMLAAIGGGAAFAWREVHALGVEPGMATGADPIWSGGGVEDLAPELTASGEPSWSRPADRAERS